MSPQRPRRTLLVDLDGTLTDNYLGISRSISHALAAMGAAPVGEDVLRQCVGPPLRQVFPQLLGTADATIVETAIGHYRERFGSIGWAENVIYDGIPELLATLVGRGHALHLCTSKPQPYAERIVALFGFGAHLAGVYGADLAGSLDDKAHLVAHVLAREGLAADRCTMIGDRMHDVRAARRNGVRSIGVLWGYGSRAELESAGVDAIVATPEALLAEVDAEPAGWRDG